MNDLPCADQTAVPTHTPSERHSPSGVHAVIVFIAWNRNDIEFNVVHRSFVGGKLGLLAAV